MAAGTGREGDREERAPSSGHGFPRRWNGHLHAPAPWRSSGCPDPTETPFSRGFRLNPVFSHAPSPDGPCIRSPRTAGASVPWAHARRTACQRLYTGSALPPPKSSQGRPAASPRTPTATGAAVSATPESCSVSMTLARRKEASAVPGWLGDVGHVPVPPLASAYLPVYWGHDPKFLLPSISCAHSETVSPRL